MLSPLALDYQDSISAGTWRGILVLVIGIAVTLTTLLYYRALNDEIGQRELEMGKAEHSLAKRSARLGLGSRSPKELATEISYANAVIQRLTLPWDGLFKAVEAIDSKAVALLAIQPDPKKRSLTLMGEAKNFAGMVGYVKQLETSAPLASVHLASHQVAQQDPQKPVRFTLNAEWVEQP